MKTLQTVTPRIKPPSPWFRFEKQQPEGVTIGADRDPFKKLLYVEKSLAWRISAGGHGSVPFHIGLLKADSRAFFTACSKAQAAADYLRALALRDQPAIAA